RARGAPRAGLVFMLVVLVLTVFVSLIIAVAVGIVLASLLFVKRMADLQLANIVDLTGDSVSKVPLSGEEKALIAALGNRIMLYHLSGPFTFGAAKEMARKMAIIGQYEILILDVSAVPMVDSSASMAIEDVINQARMRGLPAYFVGLTPRVTTVLERIGVLKLVAPEHRFATRLAALAAASDALGVAP
ncbi:MAG: STAS domain-containing protein, partial [Proteobacteria bacterium]|nr:STAS domain-containing protein [Pseudomonadota bacterium]